MNEDSNMGFSDPEPTGFDSDSNQTFEPQVCFLSHLRTRKAYQIKKISMCSIQIADGREGRLRGSEKLMKSTKIKKKKTVFI